MRAFIALELPDAFADDVAALARALEAHVHGRFLTRERYHVTLAFLGDIGQAQSERALEALHAACAGSSPVTLRACDLGTFGRGSNTTLWLGLERDEALMQLAARVRSSLADAGLPCDAKAFKPHITLARHAHVAHGELPALGFPRESEATHVTLFKSTLEPDGAVYKALSTATLVDPGA